MVQSAQSLTEPSRLKRYISNIYMRSQIPCKNTLCARKIAYRIYKSYIETPLISFIFDSINATFTETGINLRHGKTKFATCFILNFNFLFVRPSFRH